MSVTSYAGLATATGRIGSMSIVARAKIELDRINFGEDDTKVMIEILEKFFNQWDNSGAVFCVAPILQRLIAGKPLSPLTGKDDEWFMQDIDGQKCWQNIRCTTVFKDSEHGQAYETAGPGRVPITFPYDPDNIEVGYPVVVVETNG